MEAIGNRPLAHSSPATPRPAPIAAQEPGKVSSSAKLAKAAAPSEKATGDGGALSVKDLGSKPQPAWGMDPSSTQQHLEQHRLLSKAESRSHRAAMRMYERTAQS